ncbi:MAG: type I-U CRISPR-associated protein Csb2 [Terrimicrobiaceae bacterium]|nr:type I-U CRISPR-associated protein Csb2 [Terrimicrobiaceae bacterium]
MDRYLVIQVRLHDRRYHGAGEWPPSPARLFQALIAGVGLGGPIPEATAATFRWLESLPAPEILVPRPKATIGYTNWVPNNDLDAKKGDPRLIGSIRTGKTIRARLFEDDLPLHYLWSLPLEDDSKANAVFDIAEHLYQFGRGVDMAWAVGKILSEEDVSGLREGAPFEQFLPGSGQGGTSLETPTAGSFDSLECRYHAGENRFAVAIRGRGISKTFIKPPQPRFQPVSYNSPASIHLFDLSSEEEDGVFIAFPLEATAAVTTTIRDEAVRKLCAALPDQKHEVERSLVGKNPDGTHAGTGLDRVIILPLPSIGAQHADMLIRRVAISIPSSCRIPAADLQWAFSNLRLPERNALLLPSSERSMLSHYGVDRIASIWRTVTPMALPVARRRIDPLRKSQEPKDAREKAREEHQAAGAVMQALRHAGVGGIPATVTRIQRVPFSARGKRVEDFSPGSRFAKERLWHVELQFSEGINGPLVLGDGRFSGLGIFAPTGRE